MTRIYGTEACPDGKRVKGQTEGNRVAEAAARLARELHRGQKDKGGNDYFESHLRTVGEWGNDWKERTAGYLHDAAEDTLHTVEEIVRTLQDECPGIAPEEWEEIAGTLHLMNSRTAPDRETYIGRFRGHCLAIRVKLNDLRHNMDLSRIPCPAEKDRARAERYRREYEKLKKMLEE